MPSQTVLRGGALDAAPESFVLEALGGTSRGGIGSIVGVPVVLQQRLPIVFDICLNQFPRFQFLVNALAATGP